MADIVLTHSAKGTTWSKDGASYIKREKKNGKWVYTYRKLGKFKGNGQPVDMTNATPTSEDIVNRQKVAKNVSRTYSSRAQSAVESMKRKSVSAQRNIEKDPRYKVEAKAAYLKNKASRAARKNVAKGKARVNAILERLRESAAAARTEYNKKARAARTQATKKKAQAERAVKKAKNNAKTTAKKIKRKIKNAVSVKETAYITDVSTGKRRPAPTDLFDNTSNKSTTKVKKTARKNVAKGKKKVSENLSRLKKKYIVGEPGKVYPVNSAKEKSEYERIRRKKNEKKS